jgi:hypothetical protein
LAVPLRETEEWGRGGDLSTSPLVRFPTIAVQENGTYGGQGKARWLRTADGFAVCATAQERDHVDEDQTRQRLINKENLARPIAQGVRRIG